MSNVLGNQLKKYRKSRNLTVRELADLMDVSYSLISKYETGKRRPSLPFFYRIQHRLLDLPSTSFQELLQLRTEEHTATTWHIAEEIPSTEISYEVSISEGGGDI